MTELLLTSTIDDSILSGFFYNFHVCADVSFYELEKYKDIDIKLKYILENSKLFTVLTKRDKHFKYEDILEVNWFDSYEELRNDSKLTMTCILYFYKKLKQGEPK